MATMTLLREAAPKDLAGEELLHSILEGQDSRTQLWSPEPGDLLSLLPGQFQRVLSPRAISEEIAYFTQGGRSRYASVESYADIKVFHSHPKPHYGAQIAQSGGIVINRWDIEGNPLPSYLRYDEKIWVRESNHKWHSTRYVQPKRSAYGCPHPDDVKCDCAKVIDVHPLAAPQLQQVPTPPIYFSLEGCLKADALLSAGRAAVSVPSVTMVPREHLASYLGLFRQAPVVFVVPDSDYLPKPRSWKERDRQLEFINPDVRYQTDRAISWLREHDVRAAYLVPPYLSAGDALERGISRDGRLKVGIDDHLALRGNLRPWDGSNNTRGVHIWEPSAPDVTPWLPPHPALRPRRDRDYRDAQLLNWLIGHHGWCGLFFPGDAASDLGWPRDKVQDASRSLQERGVLKVWEGKPILTADGEYANKPHLYMTFQPRLETVLDAQAA
jgi:hypothetical protein